MKNPRFWGCPEEWPNETAFIVAGGTSVWDCDLESLRGHRVIAVNSSIFSVPFADFCVWNDDRWWRKHCETLKGYPGRIVTSHNVHPPGVLGMEKVSETVGISGARTQLAMKRTTTQAAMNLAVHLGVNRIVLLGVDLVVRQGRIHHHAEHPWPLAADAWTAQRKCLEFTRKPLAQRGIEVINCSIISTIDWWPKIPLAEVLAHVRQPDAGLGEPDGVPDRGRPERQGAELTGAEGQPVPHGGDQRRHQAYAVGRRRL